MAKLSKFELLPLEIRRIIYQYYLNSPVLDYNEQLRHDRHMRLKTSNAIVANCAPDSLTSTTEQCFYRQDPNEGTGYWSPFGMTTIPRKSVHPPWSIEQVRYTPVPALWQIGGIIARDARAYHENECMRISFTQQQRTLLDETIDTFRQWGGRAGYQIHFWLNLREVYVDVNFFDASLPTRTCVRPNARCQPINLRARGCPLIKIEVRNENSSLRVSSLFHLASEQAARVRAKIEAAIKFDESGLRPRGFYGEHILSTVELLMWMLPMDEEMFWSPTAARGREAPLFWQVQLDARRISRVKSKLRFQYFDTPSPIRGRDVVIDEAAKLGALDIPAKYEHVVVEMKVPARAGRDDWEPRRKLRARAMSMDENMGLLRLFSAEQ